MFFIPSATFDAPSITPVTGLIIKPDRPYNVPLKNPSTPSLSAPSIGLHITPFNPYPIPENTERIPYPTPYKIYNIEN